MCELLCVGVCIFRLNFKMEINQHSEFILVFIPKIIMAPAGFMPEFGNTKRIISIYLVALQPKGLRTSLLLNNTRLYQQYSLVLLYYIILQSTTTKLQSISGYLEDRSLIITKSNIEKGSYHRIGGKAAPQINKHRLLLHIY